MGSIPLCALFFRWSCAFARYWKDFLKYVETNEQDVKIYHEKRKSIWDKVNFNRIFHE